MIEINEKLVQLLILEQFPEWSQLPIYPVENSGHDNRTFHLGTEMSIRLPTESAYAPQIEKEVEWLPKLTPFLSLPISSPIAKGLPTSAYPFAWSVNRWIPGSAANQNNIVNEDQFATDLAFFLRELESIDVTGGPTAGLHNFYRGGDLSIYHNETEAMMEQLSETLPTEILRETWLGALQSRWTGPGVWVHGDIAPGNLLVCGGKLCGVIDFGILGVGDPACDYAMAWTFFSVGSRAVFRKALGCDAQTWCRARGWALWKALITYCDSSWAEASRHTLKSILEEYS